MTAVLVALGASVGAPLRYLVDRWLQLRTESDLPWGTFTVNVTGSLILGALAGMVAVGTVGSGVAAAVGTGFCGALTTFSSFGYETVRMLEEGSWGAALVNVSATLAVGLVAVTAGWGLAHLLH